MDAVVQLLRNALCCVKDLDLFERSFIHDHEWTTKFLPLPAPLNLTTPLEVIISLTQFYAFVSLTITGCQLILYSGHRKSKKISRLLNLHRIDTTASCLVQESLVTEQTKSKKSMFVGVSVASIGVCFFWLGANSLHITQTSWIGGIAGLMTALTVMELALLPLLFIMLADGIDLISKASRMKFLSEILRKCDTYVPPQILNNETYAAILGWEPFWAGGDNQKNEKEGLDNEVKTVTQKLEQWTVNTKNASKPDTLQKIADRLDAESDKIQFEGYREFVYFVLNFIAFYGYLLGILVYLFSEDEQSVLHTLKLGMSHSDAEWHGNFAGDLMWTIEPVVVLGSPMLVSALGRPKVEKVKSD